MSVFSVIKQIFAKEDYSSNDKLGAYPQKVHVPAFLERRYLKTSRALGLLSIISMCLMIMMGSILFMMPSMREAKPVGVAFTPTVRSFEYLENTTVNRPSDRIIMEAYIREYISLRYNIVPNADTMNTRWKQGNKFFWYSSPEVYREFMNSEAPKVISRIQSSGYRQEVYFMWSRFLRPNRWGVEFETYEYSGWQSRQAIRKRWRAYFYVGYNRKRPYPNDIHRQDNPLGFTVMEYRLQSIDTKE